MEIVPVFVIAGMGVAGVLMAMNILVSAAPVLTSRQPPSPSPTFTFPATPSIGPIVTPTLEVTPVVTASLPGRRPTLIHTKTTATDPDGVWYYYIGYPAFAAGTTPWADSMNAQMSDSISSFVVRWQSGIASVRQVPGKRNNLVGDFVTDLMTPSLASFTLTWRDDTIPGRPATIVTTITFDLATGGPIAFDDLFIDAGSALDTVSLEAKAMLRAQLGAAYDPEVTDPAVTAVRANFPNWALTTAGLKITFDEEQVAAYSAGTPAIVIPWSVLRPFMVTSGPIAALAAP